MENDINDLDKEAKLFLVQNMKNQNLIKSMYQDQYVK